VLRFLSASSSTGTAVAPGYGYENDIRRKRLRHQDTQSGELSRAQSNSPLMAAKSKNRSGSWFFGLVSIGASSLAGSRCALISQIPGCRTRPNVYNIIAQYTRYTEWPMRTNIEIDDVLMREAQKASGHATKKQTVEEALRLMIRLHRQHEVDAGFGRYRWRGNLARSRTGRGAR
jgi:Arc/MetJ family transcription regulator